MAALPFDHNDLRSMVAYYDGDEDEMEKGPETDKAGNLVLYLYGVVGWHFTASDVVQALKDYEGDEVTVRVNSGGGSVMDGLGILNTLSSTDAKVNVIVDGLAASAAAFLTLGADHIEMGPGTLMMIHNPSGIAFGEVSAMRRAANMLDKVKDSIVALYCQRCGGNNELWAELMDETTWFTADQAVESGLADVATKLKPVETEDDDEDEGEDDGDASNLAMSDDALMALLDSLTDPKQAKQPIVENDDKVVPINTTAAQFREALLGGK